MKMSWKGGKALIFIEGGEKVIVSHNRRSVEISVGLFKSLLINRGV